MSDDDSGRGGETSHCHLLSLWPDLPFDILQRVLTTAGPISAATAACVCKSWGVEAENEELWKRFTHKDWKETALTTCQRGKLCRPWRLEYRYRFLLNQAWHSSRYLKSHLKKHEHCVTGLHICEDKVASSSYDRKIVVWDRKTGKWLHQLNGHAGQVTCLTGDRHNIVSASRDWTIKVWVYDEEEHIKEIGGTHCGVPANDMVINSIAKNRDNIFTVHNSGLMRKWELSWGSVISVFKGHEGALYSVTPMRQDMVATASADRSARLWDTRCEKQVSIFGGHDDAVLSVAMSDNYVATGGLDCTVRLFDIRSEGIVLQDTTLHSDWVRCVSLTGSHLLSASRDTTVGVTSICSSFESYKIPIQCDIRALAADATGIYVGSVNGTIFCLDFDFDSFTSTK